MKIWHLLQMNSYITLLAATTRRRDVTVEDRNISIRVTRDNSGHGIQKGNRALSKETLRVSNFAGRRRAPGYNLLRGCT